MRNLMLYRIMTTVQGILLLAATIFVFIRWQVLPEQIPVHFNFVGKANAYGGKNTVFFIMIGAWVLFVAMTILIKFPKAWNLPVKVTAANRNKLYGIAGAMLETVKLLVTLLFIVIMVCMALAVSIPQWLMTTLTAALLLSVVIGIFLMYRNR